MFHLGDREKLILGWAGGLATLGIGYLIWRHENAISQQQASQNAAIQAVNDQAYAQQLEQAVGSQYGYGTSYTSPVVESSTGDTTDTGDSIEPSTDSTDLAAILQAFFPSQTAATASTQQGGSSAGVTTSSGSTPAPTGNNTVANQTTQPLGGPVSASPINVNAPIPTLNAANTVAANTVTSGSQVPISKPIGTPAKPIPTPISSVAV